MSRKSPTSYTCLCGTEWTFPLWVYAHWNQTILHACDTCGREYEILMGRATHRPREDAPHDAHD